MDRQPLRATYRLRAPAGALEERIDALLLEQTVEVPRAALRHWPETEAVLGRVESVVECRADEHLVTLAQPVAATASDPAQLLNVLFGNSSLQPDVELVDVDVPDELARALGGPRFGLAGLRRLTSVEGRALTCSTLKPMGLGPAALARLAATFARAGLDVVKDDHGVADHPFCPFAERVRACVEALDRVADETGHRTLYVPNLSGTPSAVLEQAAVARELGADAVMVAPMLMGLPLLPELASVAELPVIAHPALGGAARIAPPALFGVLFPLYGADGVVFTSFGGRFSASTRESCRALTAELVRPRAAIEPSLPVAGGGIDADRVGDALSAYGPDVMLLVGGSLLEAGDGLLERSRLFVERVRDHPYR
jgi:ribulose-bisphosphate carboxylase large chain